MYLLLTVYLPFRDLGDPLSTEENDEVFSPLHIVVCISTHRWYVSLVHWVLCVQHIGWMCLLSVVWGNKYLFLFLEIIIKKKYHSLYFLIYRKRKPSRINRETGIESIQARTELNRVIPSYSHSFKNSWLCHWQDSLEVHS